MLHTLLLAVFPLSDVVKEIEAEAERIIRDAELRASRIIEEAKKRAEEILRDESYVSELESFRAELEKKIYDECSRIIEEAKRKAEEIVEAHKKRLSDVAKKVAAVVAGIDIA